MKTKPKICKKTKKHCYSSEAAATRAMNKYDDIKRVYLCEHCDRWHLTKIGIGLAIQEGLIEPSKKKRPPKMHEIKNKMNQLINKIKKDDN